MDQASIASLDEIIRTSATELFAAYGVTLEDGIPEGAPAGFVYAASLGFTHARLKGALVITLCADLVQASLPKELVNHHEAGHIISDWTGELANQLLGRIKKKLVPYGLEIEMSTPVVFKGQRLGLTPQAAVISRVHGFGHGKRHLEVALQAKTEPGFSLGEPDSAHHGLQEGDIALF